MSDWAPYLIAGGIVFWLGFIFALTLGICRAAANGDRMWSRALEERDTDWLWPERRDG